ncbi:MAG: alkaline phosphatase family protein [Terriglobia bacterium]
MKLEKEAKVGGGHKRQHLSGTVRWPAMFGCFVALVLLAALGLPNGIRALGSANGFHRQEGPAQPSYEDTTTHHIQTVFVIMMENHNWTGDVDNQNIKGNASAPYINNTLLPMSSYAGNYSNPPGNHPSQPNYLWLEAGTNFGVLQDTQPGQPQLNTDQHLVKLLENARISWKAYVENLSGKDCPLDFSEADVEHIPFVYFNDINDGLNPQSAECIAHVRPFTELGGDLKTNSVARYNFIVPNVCDDMHNVCSPAGQIAQGDTWLSTYVPQIMSSFAYQNGGAIFIIWDEGDDAFIVSDGPVGMIVVSPFAKGGGYTDQALYTHGSTLRTLQEIFGVKPFLRDAARAQDLSDLFSQFP